MNKFNRRLFLERGACFGLAGAGFTAISLLNQGCVEIGLGGQAGQYAQSATKIYEAASRAFEDITPEQEYYIGRTIGAVILSKNRPYNNKQANHYLNVLGQTLAQFSDLPILFDGYHFQILDSDQINAFATPSGLVFVTRGMIHCCAHEDALAAVLAHEIGHIQNRHGLQAIENSRITQALTTIGIEGVKQLGDTELAELTDTFEDSIDDIANTMINNGYSRAFEEEADESAVTILRRTGYAPSGLIDMLKIMDKRLKPGGLDFAATHPSPRSRINDLTELLRAAAVSSDKEPQSRQHRFDAALKGV